MAVARSKLKRQPQQSMSQPRQQGGLTNPICDLAGEDLTLSWEIPDRMTFPWEARARRHASALRRLPTWLIPLPGRGVLKGKLLFLGILPVKLQAIFFQKPPRPGPALTFVPAPTSAQ